MSYVTRRKPYTVAASRNQCLTCTGIAVQFVALSALHRRETNHCQPAAAICFGDRQGPVASGSGRPAACLHHANFAASSKPLPTILPYRKPRMGNLAGACRTLMCSLQVLVARLCKAEFTKTGRMKRKSSTEHVIDDGQKSMHAACIGRWHEPEMPRPQKEGLHF